MAYLGNSPLNRLYSTQALTLSQGQTSVNVNYTPGLVLFFKNGALLEPVTDYTATNGSVVTLTNPASAGDVLQGINLAQFAVANAMPLSGGTFSGPVALAAGSTGLASVQGAFKNLKLSATGTNAHVAVTVDEIVTENAFASYLTLRTVSLDIDGATVGANGLDTGALAASTWYSVWVISNGTTAAGLLSLSETAPTLPSGYTHKARVGWIRTDATANKYPLSFIQRGKRVQYKSAAATNLTSLPTMVIGVQGDPVTGPTWASVSVAPFVPPTASSIAVNLYNQSAGAYAMVATNNTYTAALNLGNPPFGVAGSQAGGVAVGLSVEMMLEGASIYYASNGANSLIKAVGWEDNL